MVFKTSSDPSERERNGVVGGGGVYD